MRVAKFKCTSNQPVIIPWEGPAGVNYRPQDKVTDALGLSHQQKTCETPNRYHFV